MAVFLECPGFGERSAWAGASSVAGMVAVPHGGGEVCPVCHGYRRRGFELCLSCQRVRSQLSSFCRLVVPVSLARAGSSPLYRLLCDYKSGTLAEELRAAQVRVVAELLGGFFATHSRCLAEAGGTWEGVAVVPSTGPHPGEHPLAQVVRHVAALAGGYLDPFRRGLAPLGHLRADDAGYLASGVAGRRLLLLDDTYTSGARAQSAASALARAGATVVAVVTLARLVRPAFCNGASWWEHQSRVPFSPARCCLESDPWPEPPTRA